MKRICLIYVCFCLLPCWLQAAPLNVAGAYTSITIDQTVEIREFYQDKKGSNGKNQQDDGKQKVKQVPKAKRQSKPTPVKSSNKGKEKSADKNNSRKR